MLYIFHSLNSFLQKRERERDKLIMGIIDHISDWFTVSSTRKSKRKPMQTVDLMVKMDCEGCERRVRNAVSSMKGARSVSVDRKQSHVAVTGYVDAKKVISRIRGVGKKAELWPFVEYNLTYYPYAPGAYDRKAPSGFVRDVDQAYPSSAEEKYATFFSDDNVNACSIM